MIAHLSFSCSLQTLCVCVCVCFSWFLKSRWLLALLLVVLSGIQDLLNWLHESISKQHLSLVIIWHFQKEEAFPEGRGRRSASSGAPA